MKLIKLCNGDDEKADGLALKLWRLSQEYWKRKHSLIPVHIFESIEASSKLIEANLSKVTPNGVYVLGSEENHSWMTKRKENASKGGIVSAAQRLLKHGTAQPARSKPEPSSSSSSSISTYNSISPNRAFLEEIDIIYSSLYPRKIQKSLGLERLKPQIQTQDHVNQFKQAVTRFRDFHKAKGTEETFIPYFSTFVNSWRDWLDPKAGSLDISFQKQQRGIAEILAEEQSNGTV